MTFIRAAAVALSALLVGAACGLTTVEHDEHIPMTTIPGTPPGTYTSAATFTITFHVPPIDTGPADCVMLSGLELDIVTPDDDWAWLFNADLFIESTLPDSELPRQPIAHAVGPGPVTVLEFETDPHVDLLPYFEEGSRIVALAVGDAPTDALSFDGTISFLIDAF
jgi:hypothetical protein